MGAVLTFASRFAPRRGPVLQGRALDSSSPEASTSASDWQPLIERMASGDGLAMQELYDRSSQMVFSLALRIVRNHEAAEDVTVEVYSQIWREAAAYDARRGSPYTWVLTVARSRAIDMMRARRRQGVPDSIDEIAELSSEAPGPEAVSVAAERQRLVLAAMEGLAPEQRQAIELAFFSGLSHSEIAEELSQPLGTIKTRIRIGMMKLRDSLGHLQPALALRQG